MHDCWICGRKPQLETWSAIFNELRLQEHFLRRDWKLHANVNKRLTLFPWLCWKRILIGENAFCLTKLNCDIACGGRLGICFHLFRPLTFKVSLESPENLEYPLDETKIMLMNSSHLGTAIHLVVTVDCIMMRTNKAIPSWTTYIYLLLIVQ